MGRLQGEVFGVPGFRFVRDRAVGLEMGEASAPPEEVTEDVFQQEKVPVPAPLRRVRALVLQ